MRKFCVAGQVLALVSLVILSACSPKKQPAEKIDEEPAELTPLEKWKKHAEEQRAWQTAEGLFVGNATYLESTGHFLIPMDIKMEVDDNQADKFLSSIKSEPIYESPYQVRWQVSNKGRKMVNLPELEEPLLFKVGSTEPIPIAPYKVEVYETMIDASLAQSFTPNKEVEVDSDAEYYMINKGSFKQARKLPSKVDESVIDMVSEIDSALENITVNLQQEYVDENENYFGFINFSGTYEGREYTYSAFCYQLYGKNGKMFQRGDETIHQLIPTILLVSDQPVFIGEFRSAGSDYIGYYPIYFRNFDYYDYSMSGFLHD